MKAYSQHLVPEFVKSWDRPDFKYDMGIESSQKYVFGGKAGPSSNVFNLSHEMAHVVQLTSAERRRIWKDGYLQFKMPKVFVMNQFFVEPVTDKISRRELETMVIQYLMMNEVKSQSLSEFLEENECFSLFSWFPDTHHFHEDAFKNSPEFKKFIIQEGEKLLEKWNIKKVRRIWNKIKMK